MFEPEPKIKIDETKPFEADKLGRKTYIEYIEKLLKRDNKGDDNKPFVMSINGDWGEGKTVVLNMLYYYLKNQELILLGE